MRREPIWVLDATVRTLQLRLIDQFGGLAGVRDPGMMDSALNRPKNLWHYGEPSLFEMAAAYAFGLAKNHPFVDGNKRIAFAVSTLFLELNGFELQASEIDAYQTFLALAAGELDEDALAAWFEQHAAPKP